MLQVFAEISVKFFYSCPVNMQSIHCINTIKKDLELIIHPFLPKKFYTPPCFSDVFSYFCSS